jgi:hypothetical protein
MKRTITLVVITLLMSAMAACSSEGSDTTGAPSDVTTSAPTTTTVTDQPDAPADWQVMILADSLGIGGWAEMWAQLIAEDQGTTAEVLNYWRNGVADYATMLQQNIVREDITRSEIVFIHPEADAIRLACEPGDTQCVADATDAYATAWDGFLTDIQSLNPDVILRSAKAYEWLVPPEGIEGLTPPNSAEGLLAFMDTMAAITEAHGGMVVDLNAVFRALDPELRIPNEWIDGSGHFTPAGAMVVADSLNQLGYED